MYGSILIIVSVRIRSFSRVSVTLQFRMSFIQVLFTGSDQVNFQVGDTYGFTWTQYGVVPFDVSSDYNYCEDDQAQPAVGSTFTLKFARYGNRFYSIQAVYNPTVSG